MARRIPNHTPPRRFAARALTAVLLASPSGLLAANLKVTPSLSVSETYSDNIRLAPPGQEKGAFVTEVNPGISVQTSGGGRVKFDLDYTLQNLFRTGDTDRNTLYHQLSANAKAELVQQRLFLDARASIRQQNISLLGPLGVDTTTDTGNITTVSTVSVSPYVVHRFGHLATAQARYTHDQVGSGVGGLSDSSGDRLHLQLNSGTAFNDLSWGLDYHNSKIDYTSRPDIDTTTVSGRLGYRITRKFRVFASSGYEKSNYLFNGAEPKGTFWSAGFGWAPTSRTNLEASYGERYFGKTYGLNFSHGTRLTTWTLSYQQDVTTTQGDILNPYYLQLAKNYDTVLQVLVKDPVLRQQLVRQIVAATGTPETVLSNRVYLSKTLMGAVTLRSGKSLVTLSAFAAKKDAMENATLDSPLFGSGVFATADTTRQYGADASWNWRLGARTTSTLGTGWSRIEVPTEDRTDNLRYVRVILSRKFQPTVNGALELRHQERSSNQPGNDYRENAIVARVYMTF